MKPKIMPKLLYKNRQGIINHNIPPQHVSESRFNEMEKLDRNWRATKAHREAYEKNKYEQMLCEGIKQDMEYKMRFAERNGLPPYIPNEEEQANQERYNELIAEAKAAQPGTIDAELAEIYDGPPNRYMWEADYGVITKNNNKVDIVMEQLARSNPSLPYLHTDIIDQVKEML